MLNLESLEVYMRKPILYLILVILTFILPHSVTAAEPQLIGEFALEEKNPSGDILSGNLILSSPEGFLVLTSDGKKSYQATLKPSQGLVTSENGEGFGIITYSKESSPDFLTMESFDLYYANGNKLLTIEKPGASDFYISHQANLLVGVSTREGSQKSRLVFYNRSANLLKSMEVGLPEKISFSQNDKYVFVNGRKEGLLAFDDSANLKVNYGLCEKFASSSDGEYVAKVYADTLKFYHQGKPIGIPLNVNPLIRNLSFSPDNKYLTIIDKKNLFLFEVQTGKLLWQYTLDKPELSFISVDVSSNAEKIIAGIDFDRGRKVAPEDRHTNGFVYLFDKGGKIVWIKELSYKLWGNSFPQVKFSPDGTRFSILTREKIYLFTSPL